MNTNIIKLDECIKCGALTQYILCKSCKTKISDTALAIRAAIDSLKRSN